MYDIVLYGATGRLGAKYVVEHCAIDLKWAVGGRSHAKLTALVEELHQLNPNRQPPGIITADSEDLDALVSLAKATKVVVSFAGPFMKLGSKLVQACAENGTHYADITGEIPWVYRLVQKYHEKPAEKSAILIPFSGVDSIPSDLGTYLLLSAMREKYGEKTTFSTVRSGVTELVAWLSGGSAASSLYMAKNVPLREAAEAYKPFSLSPIGRPSEYTRPNSILYDSRLGGWLGPWVMGATNTIVVGRTYGLLDGLWGPKFNYKEYRSYGSWWKAYMWNLGLKLMPLFLFFPPTRWVAEKILPASGEGPTEQELKSGRLRMEIIAETDDSAHTGRIKIETFADVGYLKSGNTFCGMLMAAMMLVETGLTLVDVEGTRVWNKYFSHGEKQTVVVTPAFLGEQLKERLEKGELYFTLEV